MNYNLFENIDQYEICKDLLIETEGDIKKTAILLKSNKDAYFSKFTISEIEFSLAGLKETLGSTILNKLSRGLGGDIAKIDSIVAKMKENELNFNKEEHDALKKYAELRKKEKEIENSKDPSLVSNLMTIKSDIIKTATKLKELKKGYGIIADSLEKQIDIITRKNSRKADYYNMERTRDLVETTKDRWLKNKELLSAASDENFMRDLDAKLGINIRKIENQAEKMKDTYASMEKEAEGMANNTDLNLEDEEIFEMKPDEFMGFLDRKIPLMEMHLNKFIKKSKTSTPEEKDKLRKDFAITRKKFMSRLEYFKSILEKKRSRYYNEANRMNLENSANKLDQAMERFRNKRLRFDEKNIAQ